MNLRVSSNDNGLSIVSLPLHTILFVQTAAFPHRDINITWKSLDGLTRSQLCCFNGECLQSSVTEGHSFGGDDETCGNMIRNY